MPSWPLTLALALAQTPSAPTPEELLRKLDGTPGLKDRERPFEISASLARLYFSQGRYQDAQVYVREALATARPALDFYAEQKKRLGAQPVDLSERCASDTAKEATLANTLEVARALGKAKKTAAAVTCARKALAGVPELMLLEGNLRFLAKDYQGARASYDEVLARFDDVPEALYARGALTLDERPDDVKALEAARADLEQFLSRAPQSPKARQARALRERAEAGITAGGLTKLSPVTAAEPPPAPGMPVLDQATIAAFQNAPKSAEADARYAQLIEDGEAALAQGRFQEALDGFKQVMPYQPDNPRLRAGMAWSLVKLGKPMADNVWRVATQTPEAVDALGDRLKEKGDVEGARALWRRLAETVPDYAPKLEAKR